MVGAPWGLELSWEQMNTVAFPWMLLPTCPRADSLLLLPDLSIALIAVVATPDLLPLRFPAASTFCFLLLCSSCLAPHTHLSWFSFNSLSTTHSSPKSLPCSTHLLFGTPCPSGLLLSDRAWAKLNHGSASLAA